MPKSINCCCCSVTKLYQTLWDPYGLQQARLPCPSPSPRSLPNFMSIKLVMLSNHLILCSPLLLLPSIFLASYQFLLIKEPKNPDWWQIETHSLYLNMWVHTDTLTTWKVSKQQPQQNCRMLWNQLVLKLYATTHEAILTKKETKSNVNFIFSRSNNLFPWNMRNRGSINDLCQQIQTIWNFTR